MIKNNFSSQKFTVDRMILKDKTTSEVKYFPRFRVGKNSVSWRMNANKKISCCRNLNCVSVL